MSRVPRPYFALPLALLFIVCIMWKSLSAGIYFHTSGRSTSGEPARFQTLHVDIEDAEYLILAKTKTEPSFYISMHREKDDTPRAGILYTGLYYEQHKTEEIRKLMSTRDTSMKGLFVDVGANIGWFSLYVAALGRHVIAFEPDTRNVRKLHQSIQANAFTNILVQPYGAGASDATLYFASRLTNMGMGAFIETHDKQNSTELARLPIRRVDGVLNVAKAPWNQRVALVKIDVEGFEAHALQGFLGIIAKDLPLVYIELTNGQGPDNDYYRTIFDFLSLGYRTSCNTLSSTMTFGEMKVWFADKVQSSTSPKDFLFLPNWFQDETMLA